MTFDQRRTPRTAVELGCTLARRRGNPVRAVTQDLGAGGMCVITDRPLSMDEELEFAIDAPGSPHGRARVVRQQRTNCYALRFEHMLDDILEWLEAA
jgi:hypothetical protein